MRGLSSFFWRLSWRRFKLLLTRPTNYIIRLMDGLIIFSWSRVLEIHTKGNIWLTRNFSKYSNRVPSWGKDKLSKVIIYSHFAEPNKSGSLWSAGRSFSATASDHPLIGFLLTKFLLLNDTIYKQSFEATPPPYRHRHLKVVKGSH